MKYTLKSVQVAGEQHPGFRTLCLIATLDAEHEKGARHGEHEEAKLSILAEPERYGNTGFKCRVQHYTLNSHNIRGMNAVPGLNKAARDCAREYWDSAFLPEKPLEMPTLGLTAKLPNSARLSLQLHEVQIGAYVYTGEIEYLTKDGDIDHETTRQTPSVEIEHDGRTFHSNLNHCAAHALAVYLRPVAQYYWKAFADKRKHTRIDEVKRAINWEKDRIETAKNELESAKQKLAEAEKELAALNAK